jgi:1-acyl-sn-glycerol-3-phosphate acyltransferase
LRRTARALWRLARALTHIGHGLWLCAVRFPSLTPMQRLRCVQRWCAGMLVLLGIELQSHGDPQPGPVLLAANHISWLDILALNAVEPARFVSKADVRRWPLIGWMVACGGTLFIERERKRDAMRVVHQVAAALGEGERIAVFPEGTTGDGHALLPFHANLLQAAIVGGMPVQPVALRYSDAFDAVSRAAMFVGDTTLAMSVWRVVRAQTMRVRIDFLPPLESTGADRRGLAERLEADIGRALSAVH